VWAWRGKVQKRERSRVGQTARESDEDNLQKIEAKANSTRKEWKRARSWTTTKVAWEPPAFALGIGKIESPMTVKERLPELKVEGS
jgi:hypothetical protein